VNTPYKPLFQKYWKQKAGHNLELKQSHGGSGEQVQTLANGLEADVLTTNQAADIGFLTEKDLVSKDWGGSVVSGAQIIAPSPKNTGSSRFSAWSLRRRGGSNTIHVPK